MDKIQPKTYEEIKLLNYCLALRKRTVNMSDELFYKIYDYLKKPANFIVVADGVITFCTHVDAKQFENEYGSDIVEHTSVPIELKDGCDRITVSVRKMIITDPDNSMKNFSVGLIAEDKSVAKMLTNFRTVSGSWSSSSSSGCSGCSGCGGGGGCGGNNNNNNNA